jgi:tetratricopeptide (TPR) repeat protein
MRLQQARGDEIGLAYSRCYLGNLLSQEGRAAEALRSFDASLRAFDLAGDSAGIAEALYGKGVVALRTGDLKGAETRFAEALELRQSGDLRMTLAETFEALAQVRRAMADEPGAARCHAEAEAWRRVTGAPEPRRLRSLLSLGNGPAA